MNSTNLNFADASWANFRGIYVNEAFFHETNLTGANFNKAIIDFASFSGANLTSANLNGVTLSYSTFEGSYGPANMTGANVNGVTWFNTRCPDNTRSNQNGDTCEGHLFP
jgi:uncharacterized protein YjbI with pentapeptide repeats